MGQLSSVLTGWQSGTQSRCLSGDLPLSWARLVSHALCVPLLQAHLTLCHMSSACSMAVSQRRGRDLIRFRSGGMSSLKTTSRPPVQSRETSSLLECTSGRTVMALALKCRCDTCFHTGQSCWRGPAGVLGRALWAKRNTGLNLGSQEDSRARAGHSSDGLE